MYRDLGIWSFWGSVGRHGHMGMYLSMVFRVLA